MTQDETAERVRQIIAEALKRPVEDIVPEASFVHDLQADSLGMVETIFAMEKAFDLRIPDDEVDGIRTVADAQRYIENALS